MSQSPDEPNEPIDPEDPNALDAALDALDAAQQEPDEPAVARKPKPVDPEIVALFPEGALVTPEVISAAAKTWREATQREAPSIERIATGGGLSRVDVDAVSGYVAVTTREDTWRAFLPREQLATVLTLLLRRPMAEVQRALAKSPGSIVVRDESTVA